MLQAGVTERWSLQPIQLKIKLTPMTHLRKESGQDGRDGEDKKITRVQLVYPVEKEN